MRHMLAVVAALSISLALSVPVLAQANVSTLGEITDAEAAQKLLLPVDGTKPAEDLSKNGIDTSSGAVVYEKGKVIEGEAVAAIFTGTGLDLKNCSGATFKVKTFNSNDTALLIAFQEKSIGNGKSARLTCATNTCKVKIGNGRVTAAKTGYQFFAGGQVQEATPKAMAAAGC